MKTNLNIGGDFFVSKDYLNNNFFSEEVKNLFKNSDLNIINLETPILNSNFKYDKILKTGPCLSTNEKIINLLNELNISTVTAANNHILDFGSMGLNSTIEILNKNKIDYVGVGENLNKAHKFLIKKINDLKIGIVNFCENEWSSAKDTASGANPYNIIDNLNQIKQARIECDFVFVIIHGGHEYYNLPSPRMQKEYRFFAESGADAIICHHSHCISGFEEINNTPIFYGLGNMLFTIENNNPKWYYGLILKLELVKGEKVKWDVIPVGQSKLNFSVDLCMNKEEVINEFYHYSEIISNPEILNVNWNNFKAKMRNQYLNTFSAINLIEMRYVRAALTRLGINRFFLSKKYLMQILNYTRCESHVDLLKEIIKNKIEI